MIRPDAVRAEPVGSLLRPGYLLRARQRLREDAIGRRELKRVEDRAVDAAVALQEGVGLPVVTDGEMRRGSFQAQMTAAVEGFSDHDLSAFLWGEWHGDGEAGDRTVPRPEGLAVVAPLRRRRSLSAEEFVYLRARTRRLPKVTLPSPALFANFWDPDRAPAAYPDVGAFLDDVAGVLEAEARELARLGCPYLQIDAPHYPLLRDEETAGWYEALGPGRGEWLRRSVAWENRVIAAGRAAADPGGGIAFGLHMCRGNQDSRWLVSGDYAPLADAVFPRTAADRLLLEYDDARSGGFEPLRAVPREKTVVLGIVTTKREEAEDPADLARRVEEAAAHHPLDRLAVSSQCGFASSVVGNRISREAQARKLGLVVETARRVWG